MAGAGHCPKCEGRMQEGYMADHGHGGGFHQPAWHPEAADKRWWGLKVDKKRLKPVTTFRCTRCGYLENYAK